MPGIQIVGRSGNIADVTSSGLIETTSNSLSSANFSNLRKEEAYNIVFTVTPVEPSSEDDPTTFFYMKNEKEEELIIEAAAIYSETSEEQICIYANKEGSPSGGDSVTPVNSNFGSSRRAVGTFIYGEELTGLSGGTRYASGLYPSGETIQETFRNLIVLPRNAVLTLCASNGGSSITISIPFFYNVMK